MSKTRFSPLSSLVQVIHQEDRQFVILTYTPDSTDLFHASLHGTVATPNKSKDILLIEVGIVPNGEHGKNTNPWWFGVWTQQDLEAFLVGEVRPPLWYQGCLMIYSFNRRAPFRCPLPSIFQPTTNVQSLISSTTSQGGNIPAQRLDVAVNRMADKFKGGELWIGNWGSGGDLKVIRVQYPYTKLTAAS